MARSFNGSTDYIDLGGTIAPLAITMSAWVRPTINSPGPIGFLTICGRAGATGLYVMRVRNGPDTGLPAGTWGLNCNLQGVGGLQVVNSTSMPMVANTWYSNVVTYDGSLGLVTYVNGVVSGSGSGVGNMDTGFTGGQTLTVGQISGNVFWQGNIEDLAIWSAALTAGEVVALSRGIRPSTIRPKALLAFLPMNGLSSPEPDLSGNRNNGTLVGTAPTTGSPIHLFTQYKPVTGAVPPLLPVGVGAYVATGAGPRLNVGMLVGSTP